jgi:hypothetical protein
LKIHVIWLLLSLAAIAILSEVIRYNASSTPDYAEAEPLHPVVVTFGRALAEKSKNRRIEFEDLESLLSEDRFSKLRPYGFIPTKNEDELLVLKINKTFNFRIKKDGRPEWEKKKSNQAVDSTR